MRKRRRLPKNTKRKLTLLISISALLSADPLPASGQPLETLPFEIPTDDDESLQGIAERFDLPIELLEDLNPSVWGRPDKVLLVHRPRNAEEAVHLLEEAKRVEVLGGLGLRKAKRIYRGILQAARLIPGEEEARAAVEMPSDAVAQALLGWGRIQEGSDDSQAEWAYHQVRLFFPDRQEYFSTATARLKAIGGEEEPPQPSETPSGLEWFPFSPHLIVDIDARRLAPQLRRLDPAGIFEPLADHPDPRVRGKWERRDDRYKETLAILDHLRSIHIGGWVDPEIYGANPERGLQESRWVVVGRLSASFEDFVENLGLPQAQDERRGYALHDLGRGTHLAARGEHILVAREETLIDLIDQSPPFDHPQFSAANSAYRKAKEEAGATTAVFAYLDLEGFLRGPALAFGRRGDVGDTEAVAISLILSAFLGINAIQGLSLSLDYDRDELTAKVGVRHQRGGLLALFAGPPCPSKTSSYFPPETQGLLQIQRPCTAPVEALLGIDLNRLLGLAAPVYLAHYSAWLDRVESDLGARVDPLAWVKAGAVDELSVGLQLPGGMVPIPNILIAAPVDLASPELVQMERLFLQEGESGFLEETAEGHWLRHSLIPIESPLFLDLSYTLHKGTLLVSNNPDLIRQSLRTANRGGGFDSSPRYRDFREEWLPSNHLSLYLSSELASRLGQWARASAASRMNTPEKSPFLRILQTELDKVARNPEPAGFGVRLADEAMVASLHLRSFRAWFNAFQASRWAGSLDEPQSEDGGGSDAP